MKRKLTFENVRWNSDAEHERGMRDLDEQFSHHLAALQDKLKQREGQLKEMHEQEVPVLYVCMCVQKNHVLYGIWHMQGIRKCTSNRYLFYSASPPFTIALIWRMSYLILPIACTFCHITCHITFDVYFEY
jgi:hypothetical protein